MLSIFPPDLLLVYAATTARHWIASHLISSWRVVWSRTCPSSPVLLLYLISFFCCQLRYVDAFRLTEPDYLLHSLLLSHYNITRGSFRNGGTYSQWQRRMELISMDPDVMNYKSIKACNTQEIQTYYSFRVLSTTHVLVEGASCTFISQLLHRGLFLLLLLLVVSCTCSLFLWPMR